MQTVNSDKGVFFSAITEAGEEQRLAILEELKEYKEQQLKEARVTAEKKYNDYVAEKTNELTFQDSIESTRRASEIKRSVMQTRAEIAENVFAEAEKRIVEFTKTAEYASLLKASAEKMSDICSGEELTLYLREEDIGFGEELKNLPSVKEVKTDRSIKLGGIIGVCESKHLRLNDTLASRLEEQKQWFYENSGLTI